MRLYFRRTYIFGESTDTFFLVSWKKLHLKVEYVDAENATTMTAMAVTDITAPTQLTALAASESTYTDYAAGKLESILVSSSLV